MSRVRSIGSRVGTFLLAMLFLFTAVAFSAAVIWQIHQDDKRAKELSAAQDASKPKEAQLQGTQLQNFTPVAKVETLQVTDTTPGTGKEVKVGDTITAHYTGALAKDGVIFQSSLDSGQPFTAPLADGSLIKGWVQGLPGMKEGGTRRLLIPAALAYGDQAQQGIPANSDLVFDIQLIKVGQ